MKIIMKIKMTATELLDSLIMGDVITVGGVKWIFCTTYHRGNKKTYGFIYPNPKDDMEGYPKFYTAEELYGNGITGFARNCTDATMQYSVEVTGE